MTYKGLDGNSIIIQIPEVALGAERILSIEGSREGYRG